MLSDLGSQKDNENKHLRESRGFPLDSSRNICEGDFITFM